MATMMAGLASADVVIGFQTVIGPLATDITNQSATLPSWQPGSSNSVLSNVTGAGFTTGISMASLNDPSLKYILLGYDILVKETLTGNYTIVNNSTSSGSTGSAYIDTYTAVSIGSVLSPPLTNTIDPANDLFRSSVTGLGTCGGCAQGEQPLSIGGGPDPNAPALTNLNLTKAPGPGNTFNSGAINVNSNWVDYGCEINNNTGGSPAFCHHNLTSGLFQAEGELTTSFGLVSGPPSSLTFFFSSATQTDSALTGGNISTQYNTSVQEQVALIFDYVAISSAPEPATLALLGGALLGLGLIGRRLRKP